MWQHVKLSDVSLGTRPRYSLVVDEDDKKPNKETKLYLLDDELCWRPLVLAMPPEGVNMCIGEVENGGWVEGGGGGSIPLYY